MARTYNLAERLMQANQKPTVRIDKDHEYKINNTTPAALMIEQISKDETLGQFEGLQKIIGVALGNEAAEYVESLSLTMPAYTMIVNTIMASIADLSLEEIEAAAEENRFQPRKGKSKK